MLVDYWDLDTKTFQIDEMPLILEVEDIYFITGLSHQGELFNLRAHGVRGGLTIEEYIVVYCLLNTKKAGSKVLVNSIQNLGLKAILIALGMIAGLTSLHRLPGH